MTLRALRDYARAKGRCSLDRGQRPFFLPFENTVAHDVARGSQICNVCNPHRHHRDGGIFSWEGASRMATQATQCSNDTHLAFARAHDLAGRLDADAFAHMILNKPTPQALAALMAYAFHEGYQACEAERKGEPTPPAVGPAARLLQRG